MAREQSYYKNQVQNNNEGEYTDLFKVVASPLSRKGNSSLIANGSKTSGAEGGVMGLHCTVCGLSMRNPTAGANLGLDKTLPLGLNPG